MLRTASRGIRKYDKAWNTLRLNWLDYSQLSKANRDDGLTLICHTVRMRQLWRETERLAWGLRGVEIETTSSNTTLIHIPFSLRRRIPKAVSTNKINNEARLKLVYVTPYPRHIVTRLYMLDDPLPGFSTVASHSNLPFLTPFNPLTTMRWTITPSLSLTACDPSTPSPNSCTVPPVPAPLPWCDRFYLRVMCTA